MIDKIDSITIDKDIIAVKNVTLSEDIFVDHFIGYPVLPGALLIECLAQAGTALLEYSSGFKKKALLVIVEQAKFRSEVKPGDQLMLYKKVLSLSNSAAQLSGEIKVNNKCVMNAIMTYTLNPVGKYYPAKTRYLMETVYDIWLKDAQIIENRE